jgi:hypothetical protein
LAINDGKKPPRGETRSWSFDISAIFLTVLAVLLMFHGFLNNSWAFMMVGILAVIAAMGFLVWPEILKRKAATSPESPDEDMAKLKVTLHELETTLLDLQRDREGIQHAGHVMESGVQEISDGVAVAIEKIRGMSDVQEQLISLRQELGETKRHVDEWLDASMEYMDFLDRTLSLEGIDENYVKAIEKARSQFIARLIGLGVGEIQPEVGDAFDERLHKADGYGEADGLEPGSIAVVVRSGLATGRKVLRPAIVRIVK